MKPQPASRLALPFAIVLAHALARAWLGYEAQAAVLPYLETTAGWVKPPSLRAQAGLVWPVLLLWLVLPAIATAASGKWHTQRARTYTCFARGLGLALVPVGLATVLVAVVVHVPALNLTARVAWGLSWVAMAVVLDLSTRREIVMRPVRRGLVVVLLVVSALGMEFVSLATSLREIIAMGP